MATGYWFVVTFLVSRRLSSDKPAVVFEPKKTREESKARDSPTKSDLS